MRRCGCLQSRGRGSVSLVEVWQQLQHAGASATVCKALTVLHVAHKAPAMVVHDDSVVRRRRWPQSPDYGQRLRVELLTLVVSDAAARCCRACCDAFDTSCCATTGCRESISWCALRQCNCCRAPSTATGSIWWCSWRRSHSGTAAMVCFDWKGCRVAAAPHAYAHHGAVVNEDCYLVASMVQRTTGHQLVLDTAHEAGACMIKITACACMQQQVVWLCSRTHCALPVALQTMRL